MNTLDIIVLIVICLMTIYGIWKGFIRQILSIAGIVVGYIVAVKYYADLASYLKLSDPNLAKIISFIILFVACVIVFAALAFLLNKVFKLPGLGMINTFFGGVIGFLKGFLVVALLVIVLIALLPADNPVLSKSITAPYILRALTNIHRAIPKDIKAQYQKKIEGLMKNVSSRPDQNK
jgi:membrane protein required for colicin V production